MFGELSRRAFIGATLSGAAGIALAHAEERPVVTSPRATSGDTAIEPAWDERVTVTVGPGNADLVGTSDRVLQAAVDYVVGLGGGTVKVLPGTYKLRNSVFLAKGVRILGSGSDSVLIKEPSVESKLAVDSDWYDQEITLVDADGFRVGDGVCLRTKDADSGAMHVLKRTLVARAGKRFKLDRALRDNFWTESESTATSVFPLLAAENMSDIVIENLALDGNKDNNAYLDGNYGGCIWFQDCSRLTFKDVTARNNNGDGISWQICHDVLVEGCHSHDNQDLGLHPGSGSQRPVIRNNTLERNGIGIFFCWGVKYGLAEKNMVADNRDYGISIGHRDNENLVRDNDVLRSGKAGILFRPERGEGYTAQGNHFENNRIIDSGADDGIGIDLQGVTASNLIVRNDIRETRAPASRVGIRLGKETGINDLTDNRIEGYSISIQDLRKGQQ